MSIYAMFELTNIIRRLGKYRKELKSLNCETEAQKLLYKKIMKNGIFDFNDSGIVGSSSSPIIMYLLGFGSFETTKDIKMFLACSVLIIIFTLIDIRARRRKRRLIKEFHELQARQRLESEAQSAE